MKAVYLCAPYRARTADGVNRNIGNAKRLAIEIWRMGAVCLCPHMNTAHFDDALPDEQILAGCIELLDRCDAMFVDASRGASEGMRREIEFAAKMGIRKFYHFDALREWIKADCGLRTADCGFPGAAGLTAES